MSAWLNMVKEKIGEAEYGQGSIGEEVEVYIRQREQGPILV